MTDRVRAGVLSDTHLDHLTDELLNTCRTCFDGADLILHAGDITAPLVLEELEAHGWKIMAVRGNMDFHPALQDLPAAQVLELGGVKVGLCHGAGSAGSVRARILKAFDPEVPQVVVYGHTHRATDTVERGIRYVNPGSPTDRRFAPYRSVATLICEDGRADFKIIRLGD